jgi:uncharacterized protein (UPF0218 family)
MVNNVRGSCLCSVGDIVYHHCFEVVVSVVGIGDIVYHHCLEVVVIVVVLVPLFTITV